MTELVLALDAQSRSREIVRSTATSTALQVWGSLDSYTGNGVVDTFLDAIVPVVLAGQRTTQLTTSVYIAAALSAALGEPISPATVDLAGAAILRGVEAVEVYRRPFVEVWTGLKNGQPWEQAVSTGADRLVRLVEDDLSLAHRHAVLQSVGEDDRVTGYRRVIRPELARGGTCGLCIGASDRVYHKKSLLPVHTRCHCEVTPIVKTRTGTSDPGRVINGRDISDLYASMPGTQKAELASARYSVHEHGELGPILRRFADNFLGPGDLKVAA